MKTNTVTKRGHKRKIKASEDAVTTNVDSPKLSPNITATVEPRDSVRRQPSMVQDHTESSVSLIFIC